MRHIFVLIPAVALSSLLLLSCTSSEKETDSVKTEEAPSLTSQINTGPGIPPDPIAVTGPDEAVIKKTKTVKTAQRPALPPAPRGLMSFTSVNPLGARSRTTLLSQRRAASNHAIATLQIDNKDSATLMDMAFNCPASTYVYLYMDHIARPVDAAKIKKVQAFSDRQFSAFSRGEALQSLRFSGLDTMPPEDIENYKRVMKLTCGL